MNNKKNEQHKKLYSYLSYHTCSAFFFIRERRLFPGGNSRHSYPKTTITQQTQLIGRKRTQRTFPEKQLYIKLSQNNHNTTNPTDAKGKKATRKKRLFPRGNSRHSYPKTAITQQTQLMGRKGSQREKKYCSQEATLNRAIPKEP